MAKPRSRSGIFAALLAIVTAIGTIFGVLMNGQKIGQMIYDWRADYRELHEHERVAEAAVQTGDYAGAWQALEKAAALAPHDDDVARRQEQVAMPWLRDAWVRADRNTTFSTLIGPLVVALDRGIERETAKSAPSEPSTADLIAHRGWAEFLRERDEPRHHDPSAFYKRALTLDPGNPYANAMLGHWMLWYDDNTAAARPYFDAGAASGRERAYVRRMQLAALRNHSWEDNAVELVHVANAIRLEGGTVDAKTARDIHSLYWSFGSQRNDTLLEALPAGEHVVFYRWLFKDDLADPKREASYTLTLARLEERAGHADGAREALSTLRSRAGIDLSLAHDIDGELARLSR